ncbi:isochorismate synthase [Flavobacteriaceae bacterium M23B6Z8]
MKTNKLYEQAQVSIDQDMPFVLYRKKASVVLNGFFQQDCRLYSSEKLDQPGFVMAPFDARKESVLIPEKKSFFYQTLIDRSKIDSSYSVKADAYNHESETKENYKRLIQRCISAMHHTNLVKVVLSRKESVPFKCSFLEVFARLEQFYSDAFCYLFYHPEVGCWTGATPETLLSYAGNEFSTMALAGTRKVGLNSNKEWGRKEREEQALVTTGIIETLRKYTKDINLSGPETAQAGNLEHLKTTITGTLSHSYFGDLIRELHPTPAVCGTPKEEAKKFILENENYNREFYTGYLGPVHLKNSPNSIPLSELYVNLRCMKLDDGEATVFMGGGITTESDASSEWEETVNKSKTMKKVLYSLMK